MSGSSLNIYDTENHVFPNDVGVFVTGLDEFEKQFKGSDILLKIWFLKATHFFKVMSNAEIPRDIPPELQLIFQAVLVVKSLKTLISTKTPNCLLKVVILGYHEHLRYGTDVREWHVKVMGWQ